MWYSTIIITFPVNVCRLSPHHVLYQYSCHSRMSRSYPATHDGPGDRPRVDKKTNNCRNIITLLSLSQELVLWLYTLYNILVWYETLCLSRCEKWCMFTQGNTFRWSFLCVNVAWFDGIINYPLLLLEEVWMQGEKNMISCKWSCVHSVKECLNILHIFINRLGGPIECIASLGEKWLMDNWMTWCILQKSDKNYPCSGTSNSELPNE